MSEEKQYADRDIMDLDDKGGYYFRHVDAMTGESLHSKSDIAAELGHRDMLIDTYRDLCAELLEHLKRSYYAPSVQIDEPLEASITKAEKLLGDKNGTAN